MIGEGAYYFTGAKRESMMFNISRIDEDLRDRIIYVPFTDPPLQNLASKEKSALTNARRLKASLMQGLVNANDNDIIMFSDIDEIPDPNAILTFDPSRNDVGYPV